MPPPKTSPKKTYTLEIAPGLAPLRGRQRENGVPVLWEDMYVALNHDFSKPGFVQLKEQYGNRVQFAQGRVNELPFADNTFNHVMYSRALGGDSPLVPRDLCEIHRVVKQRGTIDIRMKPIRFGEISGIMGALGYDGNVTRDGSKIIGSFRQ